MIKINSDKANLISNFGSKLFLSLTSFLTIPIYLKFLGAEVYGLIGVFTVISTFMCLFDLGLSSALNREMARLSALPTEPEEYKSLVRTLQVIFWGVGFLVMCIVILCSNAIAEYWIHSENLSPSEIKVSLILMGVSLFIAWPSSIYQNAFMGLQRQLTNNIILVVFTVLRSFGVILILHWVNPTATAFFLWQIFVGIVQYFIGMKFLWKALPKCQNKPKFELKRLNSLWRYAGNMTFLSVITLLFVQLDKVILSNKLDLKDFGYYMIASNFAMSLYMIISPIFSTYFPKLTKAVTLQNTEELKRLYHTSCQLMSMLLLPATLILAFYIDEIIFIWTRNPDLIQHVSPIARLLLFGTACNGLMNIPFALQLSHSWVKYAIWQNIVSLVLLAPLTFMNAKYFGAIGVAMTWFLHNVTCVIFMIPLIHSKFLKGEKFEWYARDVGLPLIASLSAVLLVRISCPFPTTLAFKLLYLLLLSSFTVVIAGFSSPITRNGLVRETALLLKMPFYRTKKNI